MTFRRYAGFALALALGAAPAFADDDIPAFEVLTCEKDCPPFTRAVLLDNPGVHYPEAYNRRVEFVEAMVDIDFIIAVDGSVKDVVVETLLGPQAFADAALQAIGGRKYRPATEGGKPVEECHRARFMFTMPGVTHPGGRAEMVNDYRKAVGLAKENKLGEAVAAMRAISAQPELNLYERTMAGYALAIMEQQSGDALAARDAVRIATLNRGRYLDQQSVDGAIRLRIHLEAMSGEFAESFAWFDILKARGPVASDDPEAVLVAKLHGAIAAPQPLAMRARIPAQGTPAFWQHTLLRRSFEFHDVAGKLDSFILRCQRHGIRSVISGKANWTIPAGWSGCFINVTGAPGSTFMFVEVAPAIAGDVAPVEP